MLCVQTALCWGLRALRPGQAVSWAPTALSILSASVPRAKPFPGYCVLCSSPVILHNRTVSAWQWSRACWAGDGLLKDLRATSVLCALLSPDWSSLECWRPFPCRRWGTAWGSGTSVSCTPWQCATLGDFGPRVSVCPQAHGRDRREAQIQMQIPISRTRKDDVREISLLVYPAPALSSLHPTVTLPCHSRVSLTPAVIPTFSFSQSLACLQQRLELAYMCRAGPAEPFGRAEESQPSRSESTKPSYAL